MSDAAMKMMAEMEAILGRMKAERDGRKAAFREFARKLRAESRPATPEEIGQWCDVFEIRVSDLAPKGMAVFIADEESPVLLVNLKEGETLESVYSVKP